jgi:hypothetical protein
MFQRRYENSRLHFLRKVVLRQALYLLALIKKRFHLTQQLINIESSSNLFGQIVMLMLYTYIVEVSKQ